MRFDTAKTQSRWGGWLPLTASECHVVEAIKQPRAREPPTVQITTIGLDLAKSVFQGHGTNRSGEVVVRRAFPRVSVTDRSAHYVLIKGHVTRTPLGLQLWCKPSSCPSDGTSSK